MCSVKGGTVVSREEQTSEKLGPILRQDKMLCKSMFSIIKIAYGCG